jgi:hypothetical protein
MLMAGTIIGPGTIFLMLVGAFVAAFKISNWLSFYYNLVTISRISFFSEKNTIINLLTTFNSETI